jgi:hypothetical protein
MPTIPSMWYAHGLYNTVVFLLFVWQGWLGSKIRIERLAGGPPDITVIRRHRRFGPVVFLLGIAGFLSGAVIVYIGGGNILARPLHLIVGTILTLSVIVAFLFSRKIKGQLSRWRTLHFAAGTVTICLYIIQIYLGIRIIF